MPERGRGARIDRRRGVGRNVSLAFPAPTNGEAGDSTSVFVFGTRFTTSRVVKCVGIEWYRPVTPPPGGVTLSLWLVSSTAKLATVVAGAGTVPAGPGLLRLYFATPVELAVATQYMASVMTTRHVKTDLFVNPFTTAPLVTTSNNGWVGLPPEVMPASESGFATNYHVSPIVRV